MISIVEAISDLLYVRETVVVPGLGAFVKKPVSAKVNPVANYFAMPSSEIVFDANLREDNDLVVNYIVEKFEVSKDEARRQLALFVSDCFNSLKQGEKVLLNQIGTLYYDGANDLVFKQDDSANYNADAFGLCDFTLQPVLRSKTKDEIKAEIEQQQRDKNTPVTVDEKAVHEHDKEDAFDDDRRGFSWQKLLLGLLVIAGIVYGLNCFKVIDIAGWFNGSSKRVVNIEPGKYQLPTCTMDWDKMLDEYKETWRPAEPVAMPKANIRIIAGCYDQAEPAVRLTNSLKSKGFSGAIYEFRNGKWFVSFGRYATEEEATEALREIRKNTDYKAWILK